MSTDTKDNAGNHQSHFNAHRSPKMNETGFDWKAGAKQTVFKKT